MSRQLPPQPPRGADAHAGTVVRNFLTLGAGELLSRVIGFGGTIWIARQLDASGYGVIGLGFAVLLYFGAVGDLGMEHLGPREVAERRTPLPVLAGTMVLSRLAASATIALLMAAVGLLAVARPEGPVLALFGLSLLPLGASTRWVHIGIENPAAVSLSRLAAEALRVLLLLALVHGPADLYRAPLAHFAGELLAATWQLVALRRKGVRLAWRIDRDVATDMLRRGAPLLLTNLLSLVIYNADVVLLGIFRGSLEVGLYLAGYTLINLLGVLGNTATLSILPSLSRLRGTPGRGQELYHTAMAQVLAVGLPVAVGGALFAPAIIDLVFGAGYERSALVLRVLIASIPVLLLRSVMQATLIAAGRQDRVLHTTAVAAVITVVLNLVLIPRLGMLGAAVTTVSAELARMSVAQVYARAEGFGRTALLRAWRSVFAVLVMTGLLLLLRTPSLWLAVPAGAAAYALALFACGGLRITQGSIRLSV